MLLHLQLRQVACQSPGISSDATYLSLSSPHSHALMSCNGQES